MKYLSGSGLSYFYRKLMQELSNKTPQAHNHDDRYYTETEIDNKITSTVKTITLLASGWQGNQYTINDSLVTLTSNQRVMRALTMSEEQTNAYYEAKLSEVGQSNGQMVIKASGTVPTIDIPIRVMFSMTLIESPRATDTVTLATRNDTGDSIKFGIDKDGNYGYIKAGADSVVPFSHSKQFISAGGNPNFAGCSFVAYDGEQFAPNSGYGTYGKTYNPLDWCSVGANTSYGESGHKITITITKPCTVSVFSFRNSMQSSGNGENQSILREYAEAGKTYSVQGKGYNEGIGITVIKED